MVDTPRTPAALITASADNTTGNWTNQNQRDLIVSIPDFNIISAPFRPESPAYGAKFDGTTDDASAWTAMFTAVATKGYGDVIVPSGTSVISTTQVVPSGCRIVGRGKDTSILKRSGNNVLLNMSGSSTSVRNQHSSLSDLQLTGPSTTGVLVQANYADHHDFDRVHFYNTADVAFVGMELWDTYFRGCHFENVGTTTWKTGAAVRFLGSSTQSTNEVWMSQCRWESFAGQALFIDSNGFPGNAPYGIYLSQCKMESSLVSGNAFIDMTNDVSAIHLRDLYMAADASPGGAAAAFINWVGANDLILDGLHCSVTSSACLGVIYVFTNATGYVGNVRQVGTALTNGMIQFAGGAPVMGFSNITNNSSSTLYTGTLPSTVHLTDVGYLGENVQTANYTLVLGDAGNIVTMNVASSNTLTIPPNSSVAFPVGTLIWVKRRGAGVTTVTAGAGVTLGAVTATPAQYARIALVKVAVNTWEFG